MFPYERFYGFLKSLVHNMLFPEGAIVRGYETIVPGSTGSTSAPSCAATTRDLAAWVLPQHCRAPRVLVFLPQWLYIDYVVRRRDVVFWAYDYLDYLPRLVSTRKLVDDGSRDINN
jgi:hypothetical protein